MHATQRKPSIAPPPRIASLAVLPVFIKLQGRRAVVVGGSAAAAWKAELLAAAGADVAIYAETIASEMAELLATPGTAGHPPIEWSRRSQRQHTRPARLTRSSISGLRRAG
jgi:uroporphyrin-III C-methyltransferase / precorrin-2 dehydrogenase / sirohydrochlorin ferrochelatase